MLAKTALNKYLFSLLCSSCILPSGGVDGMTGPDFHGNPLSKDWAHRLTDGRKRSEVNALRRV